MHVVSGVNQSLLPGIVNIALWNDMTLWKMYIKEWADESLKGESLFKWINELSTLMLELRVDLY